MMWIKTQNNQRIVNASHIVDIFVDKTGTNIYAEVSIDRDFILLGTYKDRDVSLKVLNHILSKMAIDLTKVVLMPYGGEAENL